MGIEETLLEYAKENKKTLNGVVQVISNNAVATDKKIQEIQKVVDDIHKKVCDIEEHTNDLLGKKKAGLTDKELYELKYNEGLSWSKLSDRTGIPLSTCQSRVRRYRNSIYDILTGANTGGES